MLKKLMSLSFILLFGVKYSHAMESNEDQFDFLRNKYPSLVEKSEEAFKYCCEENIHYEKLKSASEKAKDSPAKILMDNIKEEMNRTTLHYFGPQYEQFVLNQLQPFISTLAQNHPQHGYFKVFFGRALTNHTILEDILLTAKYLYQVVKDQEGANVLFLGRTPCLVQVAYEEICRGEGDETQRPVHLNFSGHPDALTKRKSNFFKSNTNIARDIVTSEKLSHYFSYLDTKNILNTNKIFIVDILASGGSLNSFLRILHAYYQSREATMPELLFLNLTQDMNWSIDRSEFYTFEKTGERSNHGILTLPEDHEKNMKLFQLAAYSIPIFDKVLTTILDNDMFQELLVHGIQYPAQKWTPQFDEQREKGGAYHQEFYQYLRQNFRDLMESHKPAF
ncbi:hypothetical protein [Candidatus Odyssella acanthamoebae]|uniref:Uncharacterized protein n=1 Tax=Candidatus Odyssella acanthamoebae TaxID=91604 RepID=A0A077AUQ4_9PROT|nr:hypothetical protein [Candidatus Paracaedibacter acanthamoebae]AIK95759.1 hypothetical protein ID47_01920 [Candidatus Paracaedibacter acanthamoebae]